MSLGNAFHHIVGAVFAPAHQCNHSHCVGGLYRLQRFNDDGDNDNNNNYNKIQYLVFCSNTAFVHTFVDDVKERKKNHMTTTTMGEEEKSAVW